MNVNRPLESVRLIVTRPLEDARPLSDLLAADGHDVIVAPLLSIRPVDDLTIPGRDYQAVLITSANGARALSRCPERERLKPAMAIAVGPASAEAAARAGFARVEQAGGDVTALVRAANALLRPGDGPLLYVSGAVTAGNLVAKLAASGFEVDRVVAYEARPAAALPDRCAAVLAAGGADGVILYSPRTARIWATLVSAADLHREASRLIHYCLSDNVAAAVRAGLGVGVTVQVAARPDETALLEMIASSA